MKLPATVTKLEPHALYCLTMKEIDVDVKHPVYAKEGQCIYEKKTGELIAAIVKKDKILISSKVTVLSKKACMVGMKRDGKLKRIDIPETVKKLVTGWIFLIVLVAKCIFIQRCHR